MAGLENEEEIEVIIQIKENYTENPTDEYIEKNWKTLLLNATRSPYTEDNELITEAYKEYKDDKGPF